MKTFLWLLSIIYLCARFFTRQIFIKNKPQKARNLKDTLKAHFC